jgi:hypothetical protein
MEHDGPCTRAGTARGHVEQPQRTGTRWIRGLADALDENKAFVKFNVAFVGLLGRRTSSRPKQTFHYALRLQLPPADHNLDGTLTASQAAGAAFYNRPLGPATGLRGATRLTRRWARSARAGSPASELLGETQHFRSRLRSITEGRRFGATCSAPRPRLGQPGPTGARRRYFHDGSADTL